MASIGGMDLGYGSQTQLIRTNVLCVNVASTGVSANGAKNLHSILNKGMPSMIAPDFTYFFQTSDTDGAGLTQTAQESLFNADPDNDGVVETTLFEKAGVLRNLKETPIISGGAHPNRASGGAAASLAASVAFGNTINDLLDATDADVAGGNMALQGVLNAAVIDLDSATASSEADDLFTAADDDADNQGGATEDITVSGLVSGVYADAMTQAYENFAGTATFSGSVVAGHSTGGGNVFTMNLLPLLEKSDIKAHTGITPGSAVNSLRSHKDSNGTGAANTVGDALAAIADSAAIISVLSLGKVV